MGFVIVAGRADAPPRAEAAPRADAGRADAGPLLAVSGLSVSYGQLRALDNVSLSVRTGELVALATTPFLPPGLPELLALAALVSTRGRPT